MTPAQGTAHTCWLEPRSNGPLRCGLNSCPSYISAWCNLPQFAKIPQGCTAMPCFYFAWYSHVLPWKLGATSLLVAVPRLGGLGHRIFSRPFLTPGGQQMLPEVLKAS